MIISILNALVEALQDHQPVSKVWISRSRRGGKIETVKNLCRENHLVIQWVPQQAIDRRLGPKNQGILAELSPVRFHSLSDILENQRQGLILILEGITDPGNLGAIVRTAAAAEVDGIIMPARHSAPINETVLKTSSGTLGKVKLALVGNLNQEIRKLKEKNFWIIASDRRSTLTHYRCNFKGPIALVFGSENRGISPLLKKNCDQVISIPLAPNVESLNVSVAVGVILFEVLRQRAT